MIWTGKTFYRLQQTVTWCSTRTNNIWAARGPDPAVTSAVRGSNHPIGPSVFPSGSTRPAPTWRVSERWRYVLKSNLVDIIHSFSYQFKARFIWTQRDCQQQQQQSEPVDFLVHQIRFDDFHCPLASGQSSWRKMVLQSSKSNQIIRLSNRYERHQRIYTKFLVFGNTKISWTELSVIYVFVFVYFTHNQRIYLPGSTRYPIFIHRSSLGYIIFQGYTFDI